MFVRSGFHRQGKLPALLDALHPVPGVALPNVHEDPNQPVQGGLPGQHYHISAAMYEALLAKISDPPLMTEAVVENAGDFVRAANNDLIYVLKAAPYVPVSPTAPGDSGSAPVPYEPAPTPDVVTPPVTPPEPDVEHDLYFNQVVALSNMNVATGTATIVEEDLYSSVGAVAGSTTTAVGSASYPLYGNNTLEVLDPSRPLTSFAFLSLYTKQSGGTTPTLFGAFTYEINLAMVTGGTDYLSMTIGAYNFAVRAEVSPNGTGYLRVYNDSAVLAEDSFVFNHVAGTFYHFALERTDANLISLFINGTLLAQFTYAGAIQGYAQAIAHVYGPYRITKGVARFNATSFTPPSSPFLTA